MLFGLSVQCCGLVVYLTVFMFVTIVCYIVMTWSEAPPFGHYRVLFDLSCYITAFI